MTRGYGSVCVLMLLLMSLSLPSKAADRVQLNSANDVIEVTGPGWKLRYSKAVPSRLPDKVDATQIVKAGRTRAYFSHGPCLRWVDTEKGVIIGRWLMPGIVTRIVPLDSNGKAEITTLEPTKGSGEVKLILDPDAANVPPPVFHEYFLENFLPQKEVRLYDDGAGDASRARVLLPEVREAVRRDPHSPWFQIALGKLLLHAGNSEAEAVLDRAVDLPMSYLELIPISAYLETLGMSRQADKAFERGYQDFLKNGNDPRLMTSLIGRLILYPADFRKIPTARRKIVAERTYLLGPYIEAGDLAWTHYSLAATDPAERKRWSQRADETRTRSGHVFGPFILSFDRVLLFAPAIGLGWPILATILICQYDKQRRHDRKISQVMHDLPRPGNRILRLRARLSFFNVQYWSLPQRIGFLLIFVLGWFVYGWMGQSITPALLQGQAPVGMGTGSLEKPTVRDFLQARLAPAPERDLLLALSFQQAGELSKAIELYSRLPQYPESWNNLGVIWRQQGTDPEAVNAFRKALELDPALAEARWNLKGVSSSAWTQLHQRYLPGLPMLAVPSQAVWRNAFVGGPSSTWWKRVALGPLRPFTVDFDSFNAVQSAATFGSVMGAVARWSLIVALLLLILPTRPVTEQPGWFGKSVCVVLPGTARAWGYAGGLALVLWFYLIFEIAATALYGSPYILTMIAVPNLMRAFGIDASTNDTLALLNPSRIWMYSAAGLLFLLNLWLIFPDIRTRIRVRTKGGCEVNAASA